MQVYVMDVYPGFAASAVAASQLLEDWFFLVFLPFAPATYMQLGYGWGNNLLAFVFIVLEIPAPLFLWKFGSSWRAKGKVSLRGDCLFNRLQSVL
jgi:hypothetical protein